MDPREILEIADSLGSVIARLGEDVLDHNLMVRVVRAETMLRTLAKEDR